MDIGGIAILDHRLAVIERRQQKSICRVSIYLFSSGRHVKTEILPPLQHTLRVTSLTAPGRRADSLSLSLQSAYQRHNHRLPIKDLLSHTHTFSLAPLVTNYFLWVPLISLFLILHSRFINYHLQIETSTDNLCNHHLPLFSDFVSNCVHSQVCLSLAHSQPFKL